MPQWCPSDPHVSLLRTSATRRLWPYFLTLSGDAVSSRANCAAVLLPCPLALRAAFPASPAAPRACFPLREWPGGFRLARARGGLARSA